MAISRHVDLLEPINLAEHLDKVELYLGQVCQIAGISKMQLDYWTNKAQIPTKGKKQRIYDMDALETVMLIKQAKDKGLNLGAAIEAARRFREQPARRLVVASSQAVCSRRVLGRDRVHVDPGAELEAGEHARAAARARGGRSCSHAFHGSGPSSARSRADDVAEQQERAPRARTARRRSASRRGGGRRGAPPRACRRAPRRRARAAARGSRSRGLARHRGRRLAEPDELRVRVRQARARRRALVDERVDVGEALRARRVAPRLPCLRDRRDLVVASARRSVRTCRGEWTTTSCRSNAG